jgi:hypothetical protein
MWGRIVRVEITGTTGLLVATEELRVDFNYLHEWGLNDLCSVQIFNLSRETFKSLTTDKALAIKLSAGHRDFKGDLPVILEGNVNNVWGQKVVPNHITNLYCVPSALYLASANVPVPSAARDSTFGEHLLNVAKAMGISEVAYVGKAKEVKDTLLEKRAVDTTLYSELISLGRMKDVKIRVHNQQMIVEADPGILGAIKAAKEDATSVPPVILDSLLLRGTPKLTNSQIEVPYILSSHIVSGNIIDIGVPSEPSSIASLADISGLGANLNRDNGIIDYATSQLYMVMKVNHTGSAYTKQWHSSIIASTFRLNTKGDI